MNPPDDLGKGRRRMECGDSSPLSLPRRVAEETPAESKRVEMSPSASGRKAASAEAEPAAVRQVALQQSGDKSPHSKELSSSGTSPAKPWPHAPVHKLSEHGVYLVTAATLQKEHFFVGPERLSLLETRLLELANHYHWQIEAWAAFPNHYHYVARGNPGSVSLRKYITHLHADTARELNRLDGETGRKVWYNFWDTRLTFEKSYLARLNYVHQNAVKHGVVPVASQYRWCSAAWFERVATPAMVQTLYNFKTDQVEVPDDF